MHVAVSTSAAGGRCGLVDGAAAALRNTCAPGVLTAYVRGQCMAGGSAMAMLLSVSPEPVLGGSSGAASATSSLAEHSPPTCLPQPARLWRQDRLQVLCCYGPYAVSSVQIYLLSSWRLSRWRVSCCILWHFVHDRPSPGMLACASVGGKQGGGHTSWCVGCRPSPVPSNARGKWRTVKSVYISTCTTAWCNALHAHAAMKALSSRL